MKRFVCVILLVSVVAAEPPRYRQARRFRVARQEAEGSGEKESKSEGGEAPYPAAGYKPLQEFNLPSRTELAPPSTSYGTPDNSYNAPFKTYIAPQTEYGPPSGRSKEGEADESESSEEGNSSEEGGKEKKEGEKTENPEKEKGGKKEKESDDDLVSAKGAYYVLLPGAQLQRVQFQTENDLNQMAYTARLQYRNEDRAPIYFYTAAVPQYQAPSAAYSYFNAW